MESPVLVAPDVWTPLTGSPILLLVLGGGVVLALLIVWRLCWAEVFTAWKDSRALRAVQWTRAAREGESGGEDAFEFPDSFRRRTDDDPHLGLFAAISGVLLVCSLAWLGSLFSWGFHDARPRTTAEEAAPWLLALFLPLFAWVWLGVERTSTSDQAWTPLWPMAGVSSPVERRQRIRRWIVVQARHLSVGVVLLGWAGATTRDWVLAPHWQGAIGGPGVPWAGTHLLWVVILLVSAAVVFQHGVAVKKEMAGAPSWGWIRWALGGSLGTPQRAEAQRIAMERILAGGELAKRVGGGTGWRGEEEYTAGAWLWLSLLLLDPSSEQRAPVSLLRPLLTSPDRDVRLRATRLLGERGALDTSLANRNEEGSSAEATS